MSRFKVIFEVEYVTEAESSEEATKKALQDMKHTSISVSDVQLVSYGLG